MPKTYDNTIDAAPAEFTRAAAVKAMILAAAFFAALSAPLTLLVKEWGSHEFSHGALVPFVSLYFVWAERDKLKDIPLRPAIIPGISVILLAGLVLMAGKAGRVAVAEEASILVIIPGLVLLFLGRRHLRALMLPLFYLAFMVPLLHPVINRLHMPFQIFTARFAAFVLPHLGVPVYQRMQFLELPNISLEVARECSGLNFMESIYAVAIPLAYFTQRGWGRKLALLSLAFAIGVLTNGVRVTLIGVWTYFNLGDALHGPYHLLQGYFVAIMGFILLFLTSVALNRARSSRPAEVEKDSIPHDGGYPKTIMSGPFFIALALFAGIGLYMHFFEITPVPLRQSLERLPLSIGDWRAETISGVRSPVRMPGARSELTRLYRKASGSEALLYIGYLDSQRDGSELVNDYFNDYFNGITEVSVPDIRGTMFLNKKIMKAGGKEYLALFWYDLDGTAFTDRRAVKLRSAYDGLVRGHTNGAVVMIISELDGREYSDNVFHDGETLAQGLRPLLRGFFSPDACL